MALRKSEKANIRKWYAIYIEAGLIMALALMIAAFRISWDYEEPQMPVTQEQETVQMKEVKQTTQTKEPPPPPAPPVPVEAPNEEVVEEQELDLDTQLDINEPVQTTPPPPPENSGEEEQQQEPEIFQAVENMPELLPNEAAARKKLSQCITYPEMAKRAGVSGTIVVKFVVNEQGKVAQPGVMKGTEKGAGLDKEAIRCVKKMKFKPGKQRGKPVKVRYTMPVNFSLN